MAIIGWDDRIPVGYFVDTAYYPWSAIVSIQATFPNGQSYIGSGALVGPNDVLTAGHVLYSPYDGGYATSVTVIPGRYGWYEPYGRIAAKSIQVDQTFVGERAFTWVAENHDYGIITLTTDVGNSTGWLGTGYVTNPVGLVGRAVESAGYPGDYFNGWDGSYMAYTAGTIDRATFTQLEFVDDLDTYPGQSGSPVVISEGEQTYIIGVVSNQSFYPSTVNGVLAISGEFDNYITFWTQHNDETSGPDSIYGGPWSETWHGYQGNDVIFGGDGHDRLYGDDGNDDLNGSTGNDSVYGGVGSDFVRGGQGVDLVYGEDGDDWHVNGNIGDDTVYGGLGNDQVFGGQGNDFLVGDIFEYGVGGNDVLIGNLGNDTLIGDPGSDTMIGGDGNDAFWIYSGDGRDVIADFRPASEVIQLEPNINGIGYTPASSFSVLSVRISADGWGNSIIDLGGGNSLRLDGVLPSQLHAGNFDFIY